MIVPGGTEAKLSPSSTLISEVENYLDARAFMGLSQQTPSRLNVIGAGYLKVKVLAKSEMAVRTGTEGIIVEMLVREGSRVRKGDVLARLSDYDKQDKISELKGDLERKRSELAQLRAGARPEEVDGKQKLVETKRIELTNAKRNEEQRNQLQQTLERKRSELQLDQQTLMRARELFKNLLIARADLEKAETAVKVREKEIDETEGSIRVITETSDREADLKAKELAGPNMPSCRYEPNLSEGGSVPIT